MYANNHINNGKMPVNISIFIEIHTAGRKGLRPSSIYKFLLLDIHENIPNNSRITNDATVIIYPNPILKQ